MYRLNMLMNVDGANIFINLSPRSLQPIIIEPPLFRDIERLKYDESQFSRELAENPIVHSRGLSAELEGRKRFRIPDIIFIVRIEAFNAYHLSNVLV